VPRALSRHSRALDVMYALAPSIPSALSKFICIALRCAHAIVGKLSLYRYVGERNKFTAIEAGFQLYEFSETWFLKHSWCGVERNESQ